MRSIPFLLWLAACDEPLAENPAEGEVEGAAPAPAPAPVGGPSSAAADVGPEGPAHLAIPEVDQVSADPEVIARGEEVFAAKGCGGCHQFGSKLVGPDLAGVTERRTLDWVARMIRHPDAMTKEDPVAKDLFRSHMVQMPNQGVSDDELGALLAFLHSKQ
jgi:hypothetical protein